MNRLKKTYSEKVFYYLTAISSMIFSEKSIFLAKAGIICILILPIWSALSAQTICSVLNSIPSTPPTGSADTLISATNDVYCTQPARIYNSFPVKGTGNYTAISSPAFMNGGGLNYCGVWGKKNPQTIAFSVCVNVPADRSYYMGFASDNAGMLTIDGDTVLQNVDWNFWGIYKVTLTKGIHFFGFSVVNFGNTPASIGFELYDDTEQQLSNTVNNAQLNVIYSTRNEIGKPAQTGDAASTYSCPIGYLLDYCSATTTVPVCSQFVPISMSVTNPLPACLSDGADITSPQITAGSPTSLTYTYWQNSLATIPLTNADRIHKSGTYYIKGSSNGCSIIKPVTVVINSVNTTINKAICQGDSYGGYTRSGTYFDTLRAANGCDSVITINLTVNKPVSLPQGRTICAGDTVVLSPGVYSQYLWQDGTTQPTYIVTNPGTYGVTVTDMTGCITSDTVVVKFGGCFHGKIPNTFTPNSDGINDTWNITGLQEFPKCAVFIYNRWGQQVFSSVGYSRPWDGIYGGQPAGTGVYYYIINLDANIPPLSGFVTVIR